MRLLWCHVSSSMKIIKSAKSSQLDLCICSSSMDSKLICACFFTDNIFLHEYRLHISYHDDQQFTQDYKKVLEERGCREEESFQQALKDVKIEIERRRKLGIEYVERCRLVKEKYKPLHPSVYQISEAFFDPEFLSIVEYCRRGGSSPDGLVDMITEEKAPNVYSFPVFTASFCSLLMEELEHFEQSEVPKGRPNTMNKGGILLSELGFDEGFMNVLRKDYLMPIAKLLYPEWVGLRGLDSHRAFIVKYTIAQDVDLSYHYDNAEVTLNVCLEKQFKGGDLYFGPMRMERGTVAIQEEHTYSHVQGRGLLHRGQHMHGAREITEGERYNLIVWMRASSIRNNLCPMCDQPPRLVETEGCGAGFTKNVTHEPCTVV